MTAAADLAELLTAAQQAQTRAHAPYSRFPVGAAIRGGSGRVHIGCNVENAAYPLGSCAEAGAIAAMVLAGDDSIEEIVIVGGRDGDGALCTPCGGCRQRIREFARPDLVIHVAGPEGLRQRFTLGELLPHSFGPENLKQD